MPRFSPPSLKNLGSENRRRRTDSGIVAVLGPTNTGKTYFAIERMLAHRTGMIGLPLRLLAREVYDKLVLKIGSREVALVTGEEKIIPPNPRYWVSTVEAMPLDRDVEFLAVDEIQLAADPERGRVFTSRLLHARGTIETMFIGAGTMRQILSRLLPGIEFYEKARFSELSHIGSKKISRLPRRAAIVSFSLDSVYSIAELVRRQRGGAAVVLGALSPRTRNAQADLYQSGEVDYLVATDAIGMGLNMDIDTVAFAARRKFDGRQVRDLQPGELAQIAGRAGRHIKEGSFCTTGECPALDEEVTEAIENHDFSPVEALQWRNETLDFSSINALQKSLDRPCPSELFHRARTGEDHAALGRLSARDDIVERVNGIAGVALLWDVCQIPDFRKTSVDEHARILSEVYQAIVDHGRLRDDWLAARIEPLDRTDGDIDAISTRVAYIRTWTYLTNRSGWIERADYWQERTRSIEDALSDVLHQKLTQRFVDRRTSVLLKKLRDDAPLLAGVNEDGEVIVEGQFVGRLIGFQFILDPRAKGLEAKRVRQAAEKALTPVLATRAAALANAGPDELNLRPDGSIWWRRAPIARLSKGPTPYRPELNISDLDAISATLRVRVQDRLSDFLAARIESQLGDILKLKQAVDSTDENELSGLARGIAFRLIENFGAMSRAPLATELKQLPQNERSKLRKLGVRFGEYTLHMPSLLKPGPASLLTLLWALWTEKNAADFEPPKAGLVSLTLNKDLPHAYYYASGYRPSGERAVRIDMLERLAGLIRTAREAGNAREGFETSQQMMSLVGCSGDEFESILRSLGYRKQTVKRPRPVTDTPPEASPVANPSNPVPAETNMPAAPAIEPANDGSNADSPVAEPASTEVLAPSAPAAPSAGMPPPAEAGAGAGAQDEVPAAEKQDHPPADGTAREEQIATSSQAPTPTDATTSDMSQPEEQPSKPDDQPQDLIDVEVWRMAPRKPARPQKRQGDKEKPQGKRHDARTGKGDKSDRRDASKHKGKPKGKGRHDGPRPPRQFSSGPRRNKEPDPNSPFAVLASLKGDLDGGSSGS
ncbi:MAG: hypothetical protein EVA70_06645 [Parvularculaceae bacterium]|nr:MAG: hypothetical protein EVA70_06645 [Parvularculaceae bacterium]